MKKLISFLILLSVIGIGNMWAETVTFDFNGKLAEVTSNVTNTSKSVESAPITLTFISVNSSRSVEFNQSNKKIKFQGPSGDNAGTSLRVSCPSGGTFAITQIEIFTNNSNINQFSASNGSYSTGATSGDETSISSYKGTWTDGNAGNITEITFQATANVDEVKAFRITYTDSRADLSPAFDWSKMEIHNTAGDQHTYVCGSPFVYDSSKDRMKVRLTVAPKYEGIYGTISSSDETILKTTGYTLTGPTATTVGGTESWEIYIDNIQVLKTGSATLRFWFNGNASYKPTTLEIPITVIDHSITPYSGSYKYTWDFANGDWTSTVAQLGYGNGDGGFNWTKTVDASHAEARPTYHNWIPTYSGIDMIAGLEFSLTAKTDLCLDWFEGRKSVWLNTNATVKIPNLVAGQKITITADHDDYTIDGGSATKAGNIITMTGAGSLTLKMAQATRISSIAVSNSQYGWSYTTTTTMLDKERPTSGTFTFTEEGPIPGGTVIDEVPGVTMTVGTSGTNYEVINQASVGYASSCVEYLFTPTVNGYLTVNMYSANAHTYIRENNGAFIDIGGTYNGYYTTPNDKPLKAGKTYKLHVKTEGAYNPIYIHSFTFRPAFLNPTTNTDQLTVGDFDARIGNPAISAFPKLIDRTSTEQQNKVKFASDKEKVYLYKNNDVEIIGYGEDILVRGTVLDKHNENGLVAYYYLNSYVLTVSSYELEDQAYIATDGLTDNCYQIDFSGNIQAVGGGSSITVQVQKDDNTPWNVTSNIYENRLYIPITAEAGATYRITIPANTIALASDATTKNAAIERTFSVNADGEAQVKMIYPTGLATVGTSVILETSINGTVSGVNNSKKVKGILSDGTNTMVIDATFGTNQLVFKPTSTLLPNTTYTLTVPTTYNSNDNKIYLKAKYTTDPEVYYQITRNKVFTFTTGSASGTAPYVIENGTSPVEGEIVSAYSGGKISFTFDQTVEIEPYTVVNATPINGREATANGQTRAPGATDNTLTIDADGKTVSFDYSADNLKYDLYYEVVIPANTIIGAGGTPNSEEIKLHFRMDKNPNATEVDPATFYPHTWDFNKFGDKAVSTTTAYNLVNNCGDPGTADKRINSLYAGTEDGYTKYTTKGQNGYGFDQGADVYFNNKNGEKEVMDEFQGIRISLVGTRSDRFEIRNRTSKETGNKNLDGTDKWLFRMNGNTHYMTLSNVPVGKLYLLVSSNGLIGINSPNATFVEDANFAATAHESNTKITNTNGTKALVVNVTEAGDVAFCVGNFNCEKIGVAVDYKKAYSSYNNYFTDCQKPEMRYDLTGEFTNTSLTAYAVDGSGFTSGQTTINFTPLTYNVALAGEGTIIKANTQDTNIPIFCADVNTTATAHTTSLVGVVEDTYIERTDGNKRNFFFTNIAGKVDPDTGQPVEEFTTSPLGFYRAVAGTLGAHKSYLQLPLDQTNAKSIIYIHFDGEDETTGIRNIDAEAATQQEGTYYTITGVRLNGKPSARGIYILNGKKVMIK